MKKRIKDILFAVVILAIICIVFWNINWISSWTDVALLYFLLILAILFDYIKEKFVKKHKIDN